MGRHSLVTIDLSITSARLLLNFAALRPVDARLVAQSELVTILGCIQEQFLKMERQAANTVFLVQQANTHLDAWISTWKAYAGASVSSLHPLSPPLRSRFLLRTSSSSSLSQPSFSRRLSPPLRFPSSLFPLPLPDLPSYPQSRKTPPPRATSLALSPSSFKVVAFTSTRCLSETSRRRRSSYRNISGCSGRLWTRQ
jgi:hypothetical protein